MDFKVKTQVVTFEDSDGQVIGTLTVAKARLEMDQIQAAYIVIGEEINKAEAEIIASENREMTMAEWRRQQFRLEIYPGLFASSISGDIPDEETAWNMPSDQLFRWYLPAHELNPSYFSNIDEIAAAYLQSREAGQAAEKKNGEKPPE
jgi:hypothetical protein